MIFLLLLKLSFLFETSTTLVRRDAKKNNLLTVYPSIATFCIISV